MALGKHPVGIQASHFWGVWRLGQICPQVQVAALIGLSPGWAKSGRSRPTTADRERSPGLGRRDVLTQAIHQRQHEGGVVLLQSY
jgi:hypothetical protein